MEELDRASGIITDFLTFAKPEIDQVQLLDLADEFRHIEGILIPMANFQGSKNYVKNSARLICSREFFEIQAGLYQYRQKQH
ncbi:hypothetical protein VQ056_15985 [Paenibacillus sp. JTLBN-2024]